MKDWTTIHDLFSATAVRFAARPFLHCTDETAKIYDVGRTDYSYAEAAEEVGNLRAAYSAALGGRKLRVGLAFENRPEFFLHFLALNSLGASVMPINVAMQDEELAYQIRHSECGLIVCHPAFEKRLSCVSSAALLKPAVASSENLAGVVAAGGAEVAALEPALREAALLYTSGTTGRPKGCILSNEYFTAIGDLYTSLGGYVFFEEGAERIITPLPLTHMNALACSFMAAIKAGSCLIQLDRFHPKTWWETVRAARATIMHYLGVMPAMLLNAPENDADDFSNEIKFAFGAGCDPRHHARFENRFGVKLIEAWAMTETGAGAWITASNEPRHVGTRSFGRAPQGLETRLVDEEGRDVATGTPGELLVRRVGDNPRRYFFSGYFKDAAATEEAWRGGWFHSGDAVRQDEVGYFYFVDRLKNVIRRSGENIAAIDVESALMRHEDVAACVVAPAPDEIRGEEVMALIVPAHGRKDEAAARAIFNFAMENLIYFKAPGYIAFVSELPMTPSEKVKRGEAKAISRKLVEDGACFDFNALKKARKG